MKKVVMINGTMGVGKTATCRELQKLLPNNVFLDGDWCWDMRPFVVTEETKSMVMKNIAFLLNSFLHCAAYETIIFCWVMHEQSILDEVLSLLDTADADVRVFSLMASREALEKRLEADVRNGLRTADVIGRSVERIKQYDALRTEKVDVSSVTAKEAAALLCKKLSE